MREITIPNEITRDDNVANDLLVEKINATIGAIDAIKWNMVTFEKRFNRIDGSLLNIHQEIVGIKQSLGTLTAMTATLATKEEVKTVEKEIIDMENEIEEIKEILKGRDSES